MEQNFRAHLEALCSRVVRLDVDKIPIIGRLEGIGEDYAVVVVPNRKMGKVVSIVSVYVRLAAISAFSISVREEEVKKEIADFERKATLKSVD